MAEDILTFAHVGQSGNGGGSYWNFGNPDKDGYQLSIEGTVIEIAEVQHTKFGTNEPEFWRDGNPKLDLEVTLLQQDGNEIKWSFSPRTRKDKVTNPMGLTAATAALFQAVTQAGMPGVNLNELLGKYVVISTRERKDSDGNLIGYDVRCPRPFSCEIAGNGDVSAVRGCKKFDPATLEQPAPQQPEPPVYGQATGPELGRQWLQQQQTQMPVPPQPAQNYYSNPWEQ